MGDFIYLKADEARKLAESSSAFLKNHVYKTIKELSKEGCATLEWSIENCCDTAVQILVSSLREDGYKVLIDDDAEMLIIRW